MTYGEEKTRREFLRELATLCFGMASAGVLTSPNGAAYGADPVGKRNPNVRLMPWTGDEFVMGHRLRNSVLPKFPTATERKLDFVIIGGGIAALTAAHKLRNHDYILLEQYGQTGGNARGASAHGLWYSFGSQYLTENEAETGQLLADMNLKPVKVGEEKNAWWDGSKFLKGISGDQNIIFKDFKRLRNDLGPLWKKMRNATLYVSDLDPEFKQLDKVTLSSMLSGYSPQFMDLINGYLCSSSCGGPDALSALSGAAMLEDLIVPSYLLEGGNPALTRALAASIQKTTPHRVMTNSFVWNVTLKEDGASVVYHANDDTLHRVHCKHLIIAIPPMVAARVITNFQIGEKATLYSFRYGSYLVGNFILNKKVLSAGFDNWLPSTYDFPDITVANTVYDLNGHYKKEMGQVLTIYRPFAAASEGRSLLLQGDRDRLSLDMRKQLAKLLGQEFERSLETVQLTRWGHAMAVTVPNYYKRMAMVLAGQTDSFSFAHSSYHGLPAAESAIMGGITAANRAMKVKHKKAQLFGPMSST